MARKQVKYDREKLRAMRGGAKHALDSIKYGCWFAELQLRDLQRSAKDAWDRVYTRAFHQTIETKCHRNPYPSLRAKRGAAFRRYVKVQ